MKSAPRILFTSLILSLAVASASGGGWMTDYEAAKSKAAAEEKDLLLLFSGSDWCPYSIQLSEEVFQQDAFGEAAADQWILVELDFPQDRSQLSEATEIQNAILSEIFAIRGYPSVVLLDHQSRPYAVTGYQAGGADAYLKHLDALRRIRDTRDAGFRAAQELSGSDKAKALQGAMAAIPDQLRPNYQDAIDQIIQLDPNYEIRMAQQRAEAAPAALCDTNNQTVPTARLAAFDPKAAHHTIQLATAASGESSDPVPNNNDICSSFRGPNEPTFLKKLKESGLPVEEAYFYIGCDAGLGGSSFDLLRFAVRRISSHYNITRALIKEFYRDQDGDPDSLSPEEIRARALLTCAATEIYRDQKNIMDEIDDREKYRKHLLANDPAYGPNTMAREQAEKDLKNLVILRKGFEHTIEKYPTTLLPDGCPKHTP